MVAKLAEVAIDEYKLEQEYQMFIETLRQQVRSRKSRLSCVHLILMKVLFSMMIKVDV